MLSKNYIEDYLEKFKASHKCLEDTTYVVNIDAKRKNFR